jgi:hypothetical protein
MTISVPNNWLPLLYSEWAATKKTLHLYTQLLGKIRLALDPPKPEWLGSCLYPNARGLTTGPMPWGTSSVEVALDFCAHSLSVLVSDGRSRVIPLTPARCVADVYSGLMGSFGELGVHADLWKKPQEVEDITPLDQNRRDCTYEPQQVERWFRVITAVRNVFDEWQSSFFGRTGLQFWWGSFDLAVLRFSGKHAEAPQNRGYIMRYDLDAEFINAGFWPGDDKSSAAAFYAYIYPAPAGCESVPISPGSASWIEQMGEWILPYDAVQASADPRGMILEFLNCVYAVAGSHGGWDLNQYKYISPPPPQRR